MKKIKGKTFEFCDVVVGKTITVAVISSEDDEYGDEARNMIYQTIPNVQSVGLPSGNYKNEIEGDFDEKIDDYKQYLAGGCGFEHVLVKDENGEVREV
tara:strand:+ start:305 stop:598 length:294 start_codon:yes stop_codon:yes gene_type:complete